MRERKEIIKILDDKLRDLKRQEEFRKRLGEYLFLKINEGMNYGEELKNRLKCFEGRVEEVLSDFEKLRFDFEGNKCEDSSDSVNYNNGRAADPFDKIANYYRSKGNIFLFNFGILSKQKEIMNILDKKFTNGDQKENFKNRLSRYLLRIEEGMNDAKELLREDSLIGFFDGRYWPGENVEVNHYDNLNVNIVKSGQSLEISHLFTDKIERMERNKNEVKRVKIYSNDKLIVTVEKNDEQQRNYCFAKDATCDMEIKWSAEDEEGNSFNCVVILDVSSGQFYISKATIDGEDDKLGEVLELAKQNKDVLIKNEGLYGFLEKLLEQSQEEIVRIPSSTLHNLKLEPLSEKEIEEDEQREYENSWAASGRC